MKKRTLLSAAFLFGTLCLSATTLLGQRTNLEFNLPKGSEFVVSIESNQKISQVIMGMDNDVEQSQTFVYTTTVNNKKRNGDHDLTFHYDVVKIDMKTAMGEINFDSTDPDSEPDMTTMAFAGMVDQQLDAVMNKRGEITELSGVDVFLDNMLQQYGIPEGPQLEAVREQLSAQINDEKMKTQFASVSIQFPQDAVSVGDSWETNSELNINFPMSLKNTYTVTAINRETVELSLTSEMASGRADAPMKMNGMEMLYDLSGTQAGTIIVDRKTGWTLSSTVNQKLEGEVDLLPNAQIPDGMSWPISLESTVVTTTEQ